MLVLSEKKNCNYCLDLVKNDDFHPECQELVNNYKQILFTIITTNTEFYNRNAQNFLFDRIQIYPNNPDLSDKYIIWDYLRENGLFELIGNNCYITCYNFRLMQDWEDYSEIGI